MSDEASKELQRIKGIGAVLAKRLTAAGLDSPARLAQAAPEELAAIPGMNPRYIENIIAQAGKMVAGATKPTETVAQADKCAPLREAAETLRQRVRELVDGLLARKGEKLAEAKKVALQREVDKFLSRLEQVESRLDHRRKRAGKGLARAARRLKRLDQAGAGKLTRGLKKARRPFRRVLA
ncbi:helix-hairpin-helix domain-containing protein [Trichloromonas sp.]|uniref:helix-hairpin-helix domain-containing protein n=1 Tax=Trichloromonas sp. TaxID=3069249 RepID=UPI002A394C59|nr:helix-hairpin-helix domain-containing protein [Trichloromonas sp.]